MSRTSHDIKIWLNDKLNRLTVIVIVFGIGLSIGLYNTHREIKKVNQAIIKCEKKLDYRYFSLTHTLEDLFKVKISTYNGKVEK